MSAETTSAASLEPPWLHVRREPFEYGLLPLSNLIINEGVPAFRALRGKLLEQALPVPISTDDSTGTDDGGYEAKFCKNRVNSTGIAASLGVPEAHARLVLDALASVLPDEGADVDPLARKPAADSESADADIDDVILFIYIQTYKRVLPRPHKDAAAVADVWPTPSVFDGFLSPTSLLQVLWLSSFLCPDIRPAFLHPALHDLENVLYLTIRVTPGLSTNSLLITLWGCFAFLWLHISSPGTILLF